MRKNTKYQIPNTKYGEDGFTLIEIMVVLLIFAMMISLILANYAGLRTSRNLKIAQNELVSNLRKIQSYSLSSRALIGNTAAQYYLIKFDQATRDRYVIQAMYNITSSPTLANNIETIMLPSGIVLASSTASSAFILDRPPIGGSADAYDSPPITLDKCVLAAYKLPFGHSIFNRQDPNNSTFTGCYFNNFSSDDYTKVKDFVSNSSTLTASDNSILTITLSSQDGKLWKTVTVNGISGGISFSQ